MSELLHMLVREVKGTGLTEMLTPTCTCGWRGYGYEAYNNYQRTLVSQQEVLHLQTAQQGPEALKNIKEVRTG